MLHANRRSRVTRTLLLIACCLVFVTGAWAQPIPATAGPLVGHTTPTSTSLWMYAQRGAKAAIKGSLSCDVLAKQAKKAGLFVPRKRVISGEYDWDDFSGCGLFLIRKKKGDWIHTGIIAARIDGPEALVFRTLEGNTNDEGSREGFEACHRTRNLNGSIKYDFIAFE